MHLWHSRGWRGGENQFRLLATHLSDPWRGRLGAPAGSELARRLDGVLPVHSLRCGGLLDVGSIFAARRLVREHGIRVVHAHDSHALATALAMRAGLDVKIVASRRNAFAISSGWKYRAADRLIAVSSAAAARLAEVGVETSAIVPDAVDVAALDAAVPERLDASPDEPVVLCIAAFSGEKDHRTLLEAWAQLERSFHKARLHLAGAGKLEKELRELVAERAIHRVRFLGWREDVPALIRGADIVVLSSRSEGLGSSLCEAQAAGKPVVATRAGGVPETMEEGRTGLLSPPVDVAALAANLTALLADAERRRIMGQAGAARARSLFAPETLARRHQEIYEVSC